MGADFQPLAEEIASLSLNPHQPAWRDLYAWRDL
jgi:hypothetical protein